MQLSPQQMRALLEPIRRVAGADDFARSAAGAFGALFGASKAVFVARPSPAGSSLSPDDVHFINWPSWCKAHYCRHLRLDDPIRRWLGSREAQRCDAVARLSDLVPARQLLQAPYYREMMAPGGARYVMTLTVHDGDAVAGALSLVRDAGAQDFSAAERTLAQTLSPVLGLAWSVAAERAARPAAAALATAVPARLAALTPREHEVMQQVVRGLPNKEIARRLATSPWTVKNHLRAIFRKLEVTNRTALCAVASQP